MAGHRCLILAVVVLCSSACIGEVEREVRVGATAARGLAAATDPAGSASAGLLRADEIHSVHAPYGIPTGTPPGNDLIFRYSYTASTNDATKFADWVAYTVTRDWIRDISDPDRTYRTDPFLSDSETLEARPGNGDYEDAYAQFRYDRGHLVPLGSFHGSPFAEEVNFLSVLAPQNASLNRGPWRSLENRVRRRVEKSGTVYVLAGPMYDSSEVMPGLPGANEDHVVPTAYWMVVYEVPESPPHAGDDGLVSDVPLVAAFAVPQRLPQYDGPEDFMVTVDDIERGTGLDLLSLLDDSVENEVEAARNPDWFEQW